MTGNPVLNQVALSVLDLEATERWFREGLGFVPASGTRLLMNLPFSGTAQGLPGARSTCWFMICANPWLQLEMFQFSRPLGRRQPPDFRPCDIGYTRIGVHVPDFDATLGDLARLGSSPIGPVLRAVGERRACVRSPDGVFVEIMEDDPLPDAARNAVAGGTVLRSVTMSTPDVDRSVAYVAALTGHGPADIVLHRDADEAMWGLGGARCRRAVIPCGDVLVEIVGYDEPRGRPWPEAYRISDIGILNIAFGVRDKVSHGQAYRRALAFGARPNRKPLQFGVSGMVYVNDPLGFSVELLWAGKGIDFGFKPAAIVPALRPCDRTAKESMVFDVPRAVLWRALTETDMMVDLVRAVGAVRNMPASSAPDAVDIRVATDRDYKLCYRAPRGSRMTYHLGSIELHGNETSCGLVWRMRYRWAGFGLDSARRRMRRSLRHHIGNLAA